jgi:hypothetical protein
VLLFALDLDYRADPKTKSFVFSADRLTEFQFKVPDWVERGWELWKFENDGLKRRSWSRISDTTMVLKDTVTEVGIYILTPDSGASNRLLEKWRKLKKWEADLDFNPAVDPAHRREFMGWKPGRN